MPTHASSSNHSDLKVLFEDLHFEAPREVGLIAQEAFALWPHQFFEKAIDCRRLLACEAIDVFQRNLNANFSLLTRLAGARSFAEILLTDPGTYDASHTLIVAPHEDERLEEVLG